MKITIVMSLLFLVVTNSYAIDLKGKIIEAAKDKENQAVAKEYAEKAIEYIKKDKTEEVKAAEVTPAPVVAEKKATESKKSSKKKSTAKKAIKN
jgi:hypothetical protein